MKVSGTAVPAAASSAAFWALAAAAAAFSSPGWGISEEQRKALEKVDDLKCVEIDNPFNPGEKVVAPHR